MIQVTVQWDTDIEPETFVLPNKEEFDVILDAATLGVEWVKLRICINSTDTATKLIRMSRVLSFTSPN